MKKALSAICIAFAFIIVSLAALYLLLGKYYSEGFSCSTWINGVYCTGKTVEEVNKELISKNVYPGISLKGPDDKELFIGSSEVDLKLDYTQALENILKNQNPYAWGLNIFKNLYAQYEPVVTFNEDKFRDIVLSWDIFEGQDDLKVAIEETEDGFTLINGLTHIPNEEHIVAASLNAMRNLEIAIDLTAYEDTFTDIPLSTEDKSTVELYSKLDGLMDCGIKFNVFDTEIPVTRRDVANFFVKESDLIDGLLPDADKKTAYEGTYIACNGNVNAEKELSSDETISLQNGFVLDHEGNLLLSEKKIHDFTQEIADGYDTKWFMEEYRQGKESEILIRVNRKGNGNLFDPSEAFETIKTAFLENDQQDEKYVDIKLFDDVKAFNGESELGRTYIEVNMRDQMLYYYVDGTLNMDMPIVTGNVNRSRGTPTGIFNVYNKRYHTYLRGADYVSYVNYWLGVNKGVGIHDANWRSKFGEDIYKRDGSHGCINCPEEKVSVLWEVVDVGTPVVLYY